MNRKFHYNNHFFTIYKSNIFRQGSEYSEINFRNILCRFNDQ